MAIEHADFDGVERLALVTGGEIASTFGNTEAVTLGTCKLIEEVMIGEEKMIKFSGCAKGEACTIVLRGATQQIVDEAERALHDVLCVLIATIKNEDWLVRGVKNVNGIPRPSFVPYEIDLQQSEWFNGLSDRLGVDVVTASTVHVKMLYTGLFAVVLILLVVL